MAENPVYRWVKPKELRLGSPQGNVTSNVVVTFSESECDYDPDTTTFKRTRIAAGAHAGDHILTRIDTHTHTHTRTHTQSHCHTDSHSNASLHT